MSEDIPTWADSLRQIKPAEYSGDTGEVFYRAGFEAARIQIAQDATGSAVPSHGSPARFVHRQGWIAACVAALLAGPIGFGIGLGVRSPDLHRDLSTSAPANDQHDVASRQPHRIAPTKPTDRSKRRPADIVTNRPDRTFPVVSSRNDGRQALVAFHRRIPMDSDGRLHWDDRDSLSAFDVSPTLAESENAVDQPLQTPGAPRSLLTAGDLLLVTRSMETVQ
ncbi:hypothetical protein K227x_36810 [Rubripirellula lacrimiformis]|uniref:Uncharacterized protein n=1 Tax=Rubripirellula lacrimiformis TaxID=1930273 RepID=A0A517NDS5_9BACT|nr:hypothetical protein [Rubripirellula lacrimiformis]QDT05281.1 hypothetical protein K227x_36810 [Rubripirellula lacrimiformis]